LKTNEQKHKGKKCKVDIKCWHTIITSIHFFLFPAKTENSWSLAKVEERVNCSLFETYYRNVI
jgi:hypothetical protein